MAQKRDVLSIDVHYGLDDWVPIRFADARSTHDFEIVLWNPDAAIVDMQRQVHRGYQYIADDEVRKLRPLLNRRQREFYQHLDAGGDIVAFADLPTGYYMSDTDEIESVWQIVPGWRGVSQASGTKVQIVDPGPIGDFLRTMKDQIDYRVVLQESENWQPLAVTEKTGQVVAAVYTDPQSGGRFVILPWIRRELTVWAEGVIGMRQVRNDQAAEEFWTPLIDALNSGAQAESEPPPAWSAQYEGSLEAETRRERERKQGELHSLQTEIANLLDEESRASRLKPLLYSQGTELELAVADVLTALGGRVREQVESNRVDMVVDFNDWIAVVEVKGTSTSAKESYATQLEKWATDFAFDDQAKPLLIVNAFRELDPEERPDAFPNQMLKYSTKRGHGLLTSSQLYAMYEEALADPTRTPDLLSELRQLVGVLKGHGVESYKTR